MAYHDSFETQLATLLAVPPTSGWNDPDAINIVEKFPGDLCEDPSVESLRRLLIGTTVVVGIYDSSFARVPVETVVANAKACSKYWAIFDGWVDQIDDAATSDFTPGDIALAELIATGNTVPEAGSNADTDLLGLARQLRKGFEPRHLWRVALGLAVETQVVDGGSSRREASCLKANSESLVAEWLKKSVASGQLSQLPDKRESSTKYYFVSEQAGR